MASINSECGRAPRNATQALDGVASCAAEVFEHRIAANQHSALRSSTLPLPVMAACYAPGLLFNLLPPMTFADAIRRLHLFLVLNISPRYADGVNVVYVDVFLTLQQ
jgi:hypothetical protein